MTVRVTVRVMNHVGMVIVIIEIMGYDWGHRLWVRDMVAAMNYGRVMVRGMGASCEAGYFPESDRMQRSGCGLGSMYENNLKI